MKFDLRGAETLRDGPHAVKISIKFLMSQNVDDLALISFTPSVLPSEKYVVFLTLDPPVSGRSGPCSGRFFARLRGWIHECGGLAPALNMINESLAMN